MASKKIASVEQEDNSLLSMENLDRTSPELWPEKFSGMSEFLNSLAPPGSAKLPYSKTFNSDDHSYLHELAGLSKKGLIRKVKNLHDCAYQLGVEEAKEMARGKYLNMFNKPKKL